MQLWQKTPSILSIIFGTALACSAHPVDMPHHISFADSAHTKELNINVQLLTIEAALTRRRECIYQAAMLDPHTAGELTIDQIRALCDDLIAAHGKWLPRYK